MSISKYIKLCKNDCCVEFMQEKDMDEVKPAVCQRVKLTISDYFRTSKEVKEIGEFLIKCSELMDKGI